MNGTQFTQNRIRRSIRRDISSRFLSRHQCDRISIRFDAHVCHLRNQTEGNADGGILEIQRDRRRILRNRADDDIESFFPESCSAVSSSTLFTRINSTASSKEISENSIEGIRYPSFPCPKQLHERNAEPHKKRDIHRLIVPTRISQSPSNRNLKMFYLVLIRLEAQPLP